MATLEETLTGFPYQLMDHQREFLVESSDMSNPRRACLYYKTGAGKTLTALLGMKMWDQNYINVVAPPSTHQSWLQGARVVGVKIQVMSHAKYRQKTTKFSRDEPLIVDEFHMLGGHTGQGWVKLSHMSKGMRAPLLILSATPNYNDAERVYCVQYVLDPQSVKGGYLEFLYSNCVTQQNFFTHTPDVTGFKNYKDAGEYLADLPRVWHLPDDADWFTTDVPLPVVHDHRLDRYGWDERRQRIVASQIEERHVRAKNAVLVVKDETVGVSTLTLTNSAELALTQTVVKIRRTSKTGKILIFAQHESIAVAVYSYLRDNMAGNAYFISGSTSGSKKHSQLMQFIEDLHPAFLVGTAALATGTDGIDKVCDDLIIVDDTDDDALRRQLIGRILERGVDTDMAANKTVHHFRPT